jgi:hypothetical protein
MNLGSTDSAAAKPDRSAAFHLAPAASAVAFRETSEFADPPTDRDELDIRELAENLELVSGCGIGELR